jgi:thiamine-monophosphate kinase
MNEEFLINSYLKKLSKNNPSSLNLNDDVFFDKNKKLVISVDTYNEGIHFLNFNKPELIIRKIIRSSISDIYPVNKIDLISNYQVVIPHLQKI